MPPGRGYTAAKPTLKQAIKNAFMNVADQAAAGNNATDATGGPGAGNDHQDLIITDLAAQIADAIHAFCLEAIVDTNTTGTGVGGMVTTVVVTAGTPVAHAGSGLGAVTAPLTTTGTGIGGCS